MVRWLCAAVLLPAVAGHAALYSPVPRNSNDRALPQFAGGKAPVCPCTCDNGLGGKGGPWPNNKPCGQGGHVSAAELDPRLMPISHPVVHIF